jgi:hypothetical protein
MHVGSGTRREQSLHRREPHVGVGDTGAVKRTDDTGPCVDARMDCSRGRPDTSVRLDVRMLTVSFF